MGSKKWFKVKKYNYILIIFGYLGEWKGRGTLRAVEKNGILFDDIVDASAVLCGTRRQRRL